jgi:hypothetical protein
MELVEQLGHTLLVFLMFSNSTIEFNCQTTWNVCLLHVVKKQFVLTYWRENYILEYVMVVRLVPVNLSPPVSA